MLTDNDQGLLVERTIAYRPFPALQIFRELMYTQHKDVLGPEYWEFGSSRRRDDSVQALLFETIGESSQVLNLRSAPDPTPGPGEVLVRVLLAPIHPSDLHMIRGRYGYQPALPASPGAEAVGVVEALGPGVSGPAVGTRVLFVDCWNLWRQLVVCRADRLVAVPASISDEAATVSFTTPITAWGLTVETHGLKEGDWLLQTAAGSSVGKLVLQLAKLRGFRTINVIRRREQEAEIRALSGDVVICTEEEDLRSCISEVTKGKGMLKAIDCVAGEVGAEVVRRASGWCLP